MVFIVDSPSDSSGIRITALSFLGASNLSRWLGTVQSSCQAIALACNSSIIRHGKSLDRFMSVDCSCAG